MMAAEYRKQVLAQQDQTTCPDGRPTYGTSRKLAPSEERSTWIQGSHCWIKASLPEESPCLLTGVCFLGDNIIVCDNENKTLKRFHIDGKFLEEMFLTDPCGICNMPNSTDIAITEPEIHQITRCSFDNAITVDFSIKTEKQYQCIAALDDKYVVGCCDIADPCIDFIDGNGTILKRMKSKNGEAKLFKNPASIACLSSEKFLVSDPGICSLICASSTGDVRFRLETTGRPSSVCVDSSGAIFMAHYDQGVVYRLTGKGEVEGMVVNEKYGVSNPLSMCVSKGLMAITEETPSDRILLVKVISLRMPRV